jgi:3-dehydroquinate synthase
VKKIAVKLGAASYDVLIANRLLRDAGKYLRAKCGVPSKCVVITSPRVHKLWGVGLERSLRAAKLPFITLTMPDGEQNKTIATVDALVRQMAEAGVDRSSLVIAFGGGMVGDVAGFAAAIYMRGIRVVQIPTTLLAQVDASIGGKTGVNLSSGKNLVGSFHQPTVVLIDPDVLSTLPAREYRAGFFEVIKCGIIRDAKLFVAIERNPQDFLKRDDSAVMQSISASVGVKADVVSRDEREGGLRRILNFGHTIGHALEADGDYKRLLHGEAVGWGMIAAAQLGANIGVTPQKIADRITDVVLRCGPLPNIGSDPATILRLIQSDKKTQRGVPHFVLATGIGRTDIVSGIPAAAVRKVVATLNKMSAR